MKPKNLNDRSSSGFTILVFSYPKKKLRKLKKDDFVSAHSIIGISKKSMRDTTNLICHKIEKTFNPNTLMYHRPCGEVKYGSLLP